MFRLTRNSIFCIKKGYIFCIKKGYIINPVIYGKQIFLNLTIHRLFYRFIFQKIILRIVIIKLPCWLIQLVLILISRSSRISIVGEENLKRIEKEKGEVIFVFWHGSYTLLLVSLQIKNAVALVNFSFRGNYIAQLASGFNYHIVRTSKGGRSILELIKAIKKGYSGFIAVDGPQGPAHRIKPGTIYIARKANAKIIPLVIKARRGIVLSRRWDNHFIPLPFNNITVFFGESIDVKPEDSLEDKTEEIAKSLLELSNKKG